MVTFAPSNVIRDLSVDCNKLIEKVGAQRESINIALIIIVDIFFTECFMFMIFLLIAKLKTQKKIGIL